LTCAHESAKMAWVPLPPGVSDATPILVGQGRITQRSPHSVEEALDPVHLMAEAAKRAAADASLAGAHQLLAEVGAVAAVQMLLEPRVPQHLRPLYTNPARSVASAVGAVGAQRFFHTTSGGQSPQLAVNELSEHIASGNLDSVLIVGAECLATFMRARKQGWTLPGEKKRPKPPVDAPSPTRTTATGADGEAARTLAWGDRPDGPEPETLGYRMEWPMATLAGVLHGMHVPTTIYALIEQAIRQRTKRSDAEHTATIAALFSGFSAIAEQNSEFAWFPTERSASELAKVTPENRQVTKPGYTKYVVHTVSCARVGGC